MKQQAREDLDTYYRAAGSWASDQNVTNARTTQLAWTVAGVASAIALAEAIALVAMMPLKTVVPYTLLVDKQTGYVETLSPLEPNKIAPDTALTQSFLVQYVLARESFDKDVIKANYQKVATWTGGKERAAYIAMMQASNPNSPLALYPPDTVIDVHVKSVSPVNKTASLVRFDVVQKEGNGRLSSPQPWIATIGYTYDGEPMSVADRFVNPLGFKVTQYRKDPEALPAVSATSEPVTTMQAPTDMRVRASRGAPR